MYGCGLINGEQKMAITQPIETILTQPDNIAPLGGPASRYTTLYAVNGVIQTADSAQVTNVATCPLGLTFVNQLLPKSWTWTSGPDTTNTHFGFLYQDVQPVAEAALPNIVLGAIYEAVSVTYQSVDAASGTVTGKQTVPGVAGICYAELMPPVVLAIQQLSAEVTTLQTAITTIQSQITTLQTAMTASQALSKAEVAL
jgi:hypothetical protein